MKKLLLSLIITLSTLGAVSSVQAQESARLSFDPDTYTVQSGETFTVNVVVDTQSVAAGGVGAKINYDPSQLVIESIQPGTIFGDYPILTNDSNTGLIVISGISSSQKNLFTGSGVVAQLSIRAVGSGATQLTYLYEPGSTRDSNVAILTGDGDALGSVGEMNITISGTPVGSGTLVDQTTVNSGLQTNEEADPTYSGIVNPSPLDLLTNRFLDGFADLKELVGMETAPDMAQIDPYAPLEAQPAITDVNRTQASVGSTNRLDENNVGFFMLIVGVIILGPLLVLLILTSWFSLKSKHQGLSVKSTRSTKSENVHSNIVESQPTSAAGQPQAPMPQPQLPPASSAQPQPSAPINPLPPQKL